MAEVDARVEVKRQEKIRLEMERLERERQERERKAQEEKERREKEEIERLAREALEKDALAAVDKLAEDVTGLNTSDMMQFSKERAAADIMAAIDVEHVESSHAQSALKDGE